LAQDNLAMSAIRFLTTVAGSVHHGLFRDADALRQICEKIVIPNLRMREDVEEMFEMNWVEYVRRDTEGGDTETRRRAACELVRRLTEKFPQEVMGTSCPPPPARDPVEPSCLAPTAMGNGPSSA
jgi:exportin-2 (importin alpha re-exporter)